MKKILATLLCGGTLFLGAQEPEVYQTLATHCSWPAGRQPERRPAAVPVTPNATEAERGFRLGVTGISTTPQPDFDWPEPPEAPSIRSFQAKGELRRCFLVLRGLEDFDQVNVQAGTLRNGNGRESVFVIWRFAESGTILRRSNRTVLRFGRIRRRSAERQGELRPVFRAAGG